MFGFKKPTEKSTAFKRGTEKGKEAGKAIIKVYGFMCKHPTGMSINAYGKPDPRTALVSAVKTYKNLRIKEDEVVVLMPKDWNESEYGDVRKNESERNELFKKIIDTCKERSYPVPTKGFNISDFKAGSSFDMMGYFLVFFIV